MKKLKFYILVVVLIGLVAVTYWLLNQGEPASNSQRSISFKIPATANPDSIVLESQQSTNILVSRNQRLYFNGSYEVKPALEEAFWIILKQLEAKRPVSKKQYSDILAAMDTAGVNVHVFESGVLLKNFKIWGDKEKKATYMMEPGKNDIYLISIPGHSTYLAGIFFYEENDWRKNSLFESTWRSLRKLDVQFPKAPSGDFSLEFGADFFFIPGLEAFDTLVVLDYLETFSNVRIIRFLPGQPKLLDSLENAAPDLLINIDDLDADHSNLLHFYSGDALLQQNQVMVVGKEREVGVISRESFQQIARQKSHFSYTGSKK